MSSAGADGVAGQQVGSTWATPGVAHAALWTGSASSWTDLHPAAFVRSQCLGTDGVRQVGSVFDNLGNESASMWSGTSGSWVDLHLAGSPLSRAYAVSGTQQVGIYMVLPSYAVHAVLWIGSAGSSFDLNPAGAISSVAYDVAGGQQVGYAMVAGIQRASIWTGNAASWVDVTPAVSGASWISGTDGVQQVGTSYISGSPHASLWNGTAASHVDLSPAGVSSASAVAVDAGEQVGSGNFPTLSPHAYYWAGSVASWFDLHSALPSYYQNSNAFAIWHANGHTFVLGKARNQNTQQEECILWQKLALTTYCTPKTNSLGCVPTIHGFGSSSATNDWVPFNVYASYERNNVNGLLLYGASGRAALPFGGGTMCIASPRVRGPKMNSSGSPSGFDCTGTFFLDVNALRAGSMSAPPAPFLSVAGTLVDCQFWSRDPGFAPPDNINLTDALEFEIGP